MKFFSRWPEFFCLLLASFIANWVAAEGLQVSPVTLTLQGTEKATGILLSNRGVNVIHAQVRVYHWSQSNNADDLTPTQKLVASPPIITLPAGEEQLIRIIRTGPVPDSVEDAYRLSIDELPEHVPHRTGLQFVLHYSVPVFIRPVTLTAPASSVKLQLALRRVDGKVFLEGRNEDGIHAQLSALTYINPNDERKEISSGLVGYVLPGATMRWLLFNSDRDVTHGGKIEVMINGEKTLQDL